MYEQLSKKDKAALRALIGKGVEAEKTNALNEIDSILAKWKGRSLTTEEAYATMYGIVRDNDKFIARRYDDIRGLLALCFYSNGHLQRRAVNR